MATVRRWLEAGVAAHEICVAARTRSALTKRYRPLFENAGIETTLVEAEPGTDATAGGVRLATMHRMKGLEFPCVLLVSVHDGTVPRPLRDTSDKTVVAAHDLQERCLFYVACTRARDELVVCGYGMA